MKSATIAKGSFGLAPGICSVDLEHEVVYVIKDPARIETPERDESLICGPGRNLFCAQIVEEEQNSFMQGCRRDAVAT